MTVQTDDRQLYSTTLIFIKKKSNKENPTTKQPKMKIFQLTQKNFFSVGVHPSLSHQPHPFTGKIVIGFLITSSNVVCNLVFAIFKAETLVECTQSIYMGSLAILIIFILLIIIFNVEKLFQIINDCENLVNKREFKVNSFESSSQ